jgi:hypothetical protein
MRGAPDGPTARRSRTHSRFLAYTVVGGIPVRNYRAEVTLTPAAPCLAGGTVLCYGVGICLLPAAS